MILFDEFWSERLKRRYLLLADLPPCLNYTGGLVLDSLVRQLPLDDVVVVTVLNPALTDAKMTKDLKVRQVSFRKPRENGASALRSVFPMLSSILFETYSKYVLVPRLASKIAHVCREERITDIWCVLQGQTMVRLANLVAAKTGLPIFTQVWDSIGWWLRANRVDRFWSKSVHREYDQAIARSAGFAAASLPMASDYAAKYSVRAIPVMHALPAALAANRPPRSEAGGVSSPVRIVLSGQLYARTEFNLLLQALIERDWKIQGRAVEVHVFGRQFDISTDKPANIVFRGWCSQENLIPALSEFDILYCPYWFDAQFEEEARSSFPSKITTYFAAGRPIVFHGPAYSSVAKLFAERDCGIACSSMDTADLIAALETALDPVRALRMTENGMKAFRELFTHDAQRIAFQKFLELDSHPSVSTV